MPVAEPERAFDRRAAGIALQAKGAEPEPRQADALGLQTFHGWLLRARTAGRSAAVRRKRFLLRGSARQLISCSIVCRRRRAQIKIGLVAMVKALRQWLERNQLPAIVAGVGGVLLMLSLLLVLGG